MCTMKHPPDQALCGITQGIKQAAQHNRFLVQMVCITHHSGLSWHPFQASIIEVRHLQILQRDAQRKAWILALQARGFTRLHHCKAAVRCTVSLCLILFQTAMLTCACAPFGDVDVSLQGCFKMWIASITDASQHWSQILLTRIVAMPTR